MAVTYTGRYFLFRIIGYNLKIEILFCNARKYKKKCGAEKAVWAENEIGMRSKTVKGQLVLI
jgi:hypothetical protein